MFLYSFILVADGRMDSPGYNAEYCTYTSLDDETKNIVDMQIINKRMHGLNSVILEKIACQKALDVLIEKGVQITELATDAHIQIRAMMSKLIIDMHIEKEIACL